MWYNINVKVNMKGASVVSVYKIEEIAERVRPVAERHNIPKVYLFGSYARGKANEDSDVDLLIDAQNVNGLFALGGVYADLEEALNKEIDLVTIEALDERKDDPLTIKFVKEISREEKLIYDAHRSR